MIKALIGRGFGFTSGTKYIPTAGLSSGAVPAAQEPPPMIRMGNEWTFGVYPGAQIGGR